MIFVERRTQKKIPSSGWDLNPQPFRTLVGCSTYGLFTNLSEFRSILLPMFIQFLLSNLQINVFHGNESDACVIKSTVCVSSNDQ